MRAGVNQYRIMTVAEGAICAAKAEADVETLGMEFPTDRSIVDEVGLAIFKRQQAGFRIDPTKQEEVNGLVKAVMGPNDHVTSVRRHLCRYAIGIVQTSPAELIQARNILRGNAAKEAIE